MSAPHANSGAKPLPPSWFERNVGHIVNGVYVLCGLLVVADLIFHFVGHKHVHFDIEEWPGFYAAAGFVSYIALVLTAKQLRRIVMRPESYYGPVPEAPEPPAPVSHEPHGAHAGDSHDSDAGESRARKRAAGKRARTAARPVSREEEE